jgi:anhydro-N-acetylmuramic acid kinase
MNNNIAKLYTIAQKKTRKIIGLMSGTSLDGLDVALCEFESSGLTISIKLLAFETVAYDNDFKDEIKKIFAKKEIDFEQLCLLNPYIGLLHANIVNNCLQKWNIKNTEVDLIASHGQTVYHAPKKLHLQQKFTNATLQIGDGDHIAVNTGIITLSDFRQKHIAAGGEGAPLAVYGDYLIFGKKNENRILLNIGGIANFTYLPEDMDASKIFSTDTGPGNTMMDAFVQANYQNIAYDENGSIASKGIISENLLLALKENIFLKDAIPKTTGPELFNLDYLKQAQLKSNTSSISNEDILATLNKFSADTIADSIIKYTDATKKYKVFASGGGMHNTILMNHIKKALPQFEFYTTAYLAINPDAKEAVLFAVLANECIAGNTNYLQKKIDSMPSVTMGKISFPT